MHCTYFKSPITNILKNSKSYKKIKMATLTKNAISVTVRNNNKKYFQKLKILEKKLNGQVEQKFLSRKQLEIEQNGRKFMIIRVIICKSTIV